MIPRHLRPRLEDFVKGASEVREPPPRSYDLTRAHRRKAYVTKRHASVIDYIVNRKVFQGAEETLLMIRMMLERLYPLPDEEWLEMKDIIVGGQNQ